MLIFGSLVYIIAKFCLITNTTLTDTTEDLQVPNITDINVTGPLTAVVSYTPLENATKYTVQSMFLCFIAK